MPTRRYLPPLAAAFLLAACSGNDVQETLGLDRHAPDEFVVYSRPPLSVPPDFDLKPPRPGEEGPHAVSAESLARETLLGTKSKPATPEEAAAGVDSSVSTAVEPVVSSDAPSSAEASFLSKAGADQANPNIRSQLSSDVTEKAAKPKKKAQSLYERIVGPDDTEPVVDAPAEAERLRENHDAGKPVTEGDTPNAKEKPRSLIDRVF